VEYGGLGGTFATYVKVVEEVAKACASSALIIAVQELGALPILIGGSEEQKQRFVPKLASGEWVAAYALTEAGSGSDAAGSMRMRARRDGDHYVLDGTKIWITQGSIADIVTVFAVTDPVRAPTASAHLSSRRAHRDRRRQAREKDGHPRVADGRAGVHRVPRAGREHAGPKAAASRSP